MLSFRKSRIGVLVTGSALAAIVLAGCSHDDTATNPPTQVTTVTPPAAAPGTVTTTTVPGAAPMAGAPGITPSTNNTNAGAGGATGADTTVADAVNKAIHNNAQMTGSRVTAVVNADGVARLTGTAQNQQQKALAESTARQTSNVSSVVNKIEIVPTGGLKSTASKPAAPKTKIIVVHDQAPPPAPTDDASTSTTATSTGTTSDGSGATTTTTTTTQPTTTQPGTTGQ